MATVHVAVALEESPLSVALKRNKTAFSVKKWTSAKPNKNAQSPPLNGKLIYPAHLEVES